MAEKDFEDYVAYAVAKTIQGVRVAVPFVLRCTREYPDATFIATCIILFYIVYKILCNLFTILKKVLMLGLIVLVVFGVMRGFDTVLTSDLPKLHALVLQGRSLDSVALEWVSYLQHTSKHTMTMLHNHFKDQFQTHK